MVEGSLSVLVIFMITSSVTPGPNNLMLLHGSLRSGFKRCLPHMLGISSGCMVMIFFSYWGIANLVVEWPVSLIVIKVLGTAYLCWLTWVMNREGIVPQNLDELAEKSNHKVSWALPLNYWQAALFQWVNPKAWMMVVTLPLLAIITGAQPQISNAPIYLLCFVINLSCISVWAAGGNTLRHFLHRQSVIKVVHVVIIAMTLYCAVSIWL